MHLWEWWGVYHKQVWWQGGVCEGGVVVVCAGHITCAMSSPETGIIASHRSAYLQGTQITRTLYVRAPPECREYDERGVEYV